MKTINPNFFGAAALLALFLAPAISESRPIQVDNNTGWLSDPNALPSLAGVQICSNSATQVWFASSGSCASGPSANFLQVLTVQLNPLVVGGPDVRSNVSQEVWNELAGGITLIKPADESASREDYRIEWAGLIGTTGQIFYGGISFFGVGADGFNFNFGYGCPPNNGGDKLVNGYPINPCSGVNGFGSVAFNEFGQQIVALGDQNVGPDTDLNGGLNSATSLYCYRSTAAGGSFVGRVLNDTCVGPTSAASVPEPSTIWLMLLGLLVVVMPRFRVARSH